LVRRRVRGRGSLVLGEVAEGLAGWRRTHRQARAALGIALRRRAPLTRYSEVALLSAISRDGDLLSYLSERYLAPLEAERDGGHTLRQTLGAYLAADRNVSSAAAALGIARQTVAGRLQTIERLIGQPLSACGAELEALLQITEIQG
jgi:DNA-binding PucR family transcriptional regulator